MVKSRLAGYELNTTTTAYSKLISRDIERTVKNTKDVDIAIVFDEIRNPKMPVEQDANVSRRSQIAISNFWKPRENLRPLVNPLDSAPGGLGVVGSDVLEYILKPALRFLSPGYFCNERMRCPI